MQTSFATNYFTRTFARLGPIWSYSALMGAKKAVLWGVAHTMVVVMCHIIIGLVEVIKPFGR